LQSSFEVAFSIDQECRGGNYLFALTETIKYLNVAVSASPHLDRTRLEPPFTFCDEHDLPLSAVDDRACWHRDYGRCSSRLEHNVRVHIDLEPTIRIRCLDAHARGARLGF